MVVLLKERGGEPVDVPGLPEDGGEAVVDDGGGVLLEEAAHDEDLGLAGEVDSGGGEGGADESAFCDVGDAEPWGCGAGEDGSADGGSVAVGVGFDDGKDGGVRRGLGLVYGGWVAVGRAGERVVVRRQAGF